MCQSDAMDIGQERILKGHKSFSFLFTPLFLIIPPLNSPQLKYDNFTAALVDCSVTGRA